MGKGKGEPEYWAAVVKPGTVLYEISGISEEGAPRPMPFHKMAAGMAASPTPVAQGEETLQVTVSVSWAIKPAGQ